MLRRFLLVLLAGVVALFVGLRLRDRALPELERAAEPHTLGVFHVHSASSHDGVLKLEEIAARASRLGLHFVVLTDHDRQLAGPVEIDGVTLLSYAELSTPHGHLIQLDTTALPSDVDRQAVTLPGRLRAGGGFPIIAHPADPKRPWTGALADAGGFEIANFAASARRRGGILFVGLLPAAAAYRLNPALALVQALDRDRTALRRWDDEHDPAVIGICGADAHGRTLDLGEELRSWNLALLDPLEPSTPGFAAAVVRSLRRGRFHCYAPLFGPDPQLAFTAEAAGAVLGEPGETVFDDALEVLVVRGPRSSIATPTLVLLRDGLEMARTQAGTLRYRVLLPGTYRAEVLLPVPGVFAGERLLPVAYTNRIRVAAAPEPDPGEPTPDLAPVAPAPNPPTAEPPTAPEPG